MVRTAPVLTTTANTWPSPGIEARDVAPRPTTTALCDETVDQTNVLLDVSSLSQPCHSLLELTMRSLKIFNPAVF